MKLSFQTYRMALVEQAKKEGKPVFIDFTAAWCLPCKELEIKTFSDPQVKEALGSWVILKADLTQFTSGPVEDLKKTYGIQGVPTLVFLDPSGQERKDLRGIGFITPQEMLEKLSRGARQKP
jgi:thiol:disulfide interchange protein DsbD